MTAVIDVSRAAITSAGSMISGPELCIVASGVSIRSISCRKSLSPSSSSVSIKSPSSSENPANAVSGKSISTVISGVANV